MATCDMCAATIASGEGVGAEMGGQRPSGMFAGRPRRSAANSKQQWQLLCPRCFAAHRHRAPAVHPVLWLFFWPFLLLTGAGAPARGWARAHPSMIGKGLIVMGAFMLVGLTAPVQDPEGQAPPVVTVVLFAAIAIGSGIWLHRKSGAPKASMTGADVSDAQLLRTAQQHGGVLSISQAIIALDLPMDVVRERLDDMAVKGLCEMDVSDEGLISYRFPELGAAP